jgi:hypothetical protein
VLTPGITGAGTVFDAIGIHLRPQVGAQNNFGLSIDGTYSGPNDCAIQTNSNARSKLGIIIIRYHYRSGSAHAKIVQRYWNNRRNRVGRQLHLHSGGTQHMEARGNFKVVESPTDMVNVRADVCLTNHPFDSSTCRRSGERPLAVPLALSPGGYEGLCTYCPSCSSLGAVQ